jgi:ubiquinone/menaquinone biosynthesis C-methylase UbiE
LYARLVDPALSSVHRIVTDLVPEGARVLDVGCGTGTLCFLIAGKAAHVTGVELSPAMVEYAEERRRRESVQGLRFVLGDALSALADVEDGSYDVATMVLTLHEMPTKAREAVVREACRVAERAFCIDFNAPLPGNLAGWRNRLAELIAGPEHFRASRDFIRRGGVPGLAAAAGLRSRHRQTTDNGTLVIYELSR